MPGKIKGKQLEDLSLSLNLLSGQGSTIIGSASQFQIVGSAAGPDDVVSKKDLDDAISGLTGVGSQLTVEDYNTGASFSNVQKMIFRGNIITPDDQTGVLVDSNEPNEVTVWIPAPEYVDKFSPTPIFNGTPRLIADPTTNGYTSSIISGYYDIGDWSAGEQHNSTNNDTIQAFSDSEFACFDENTTIDFILYGADNVTILDQMSLTLNDNNTGITNSSNNGLSINLISFQTDSDRFKANVTGNINFNNILPNGGRFSFLVRHNNGEGAGNVSPGVYEYTRNDRFFDNDTSSSSATLNGPITLEENVPNLNIISGVSYYAPGSTFTASAFDMDNLNEITYPGNVSGQVDGTQLRLNFSSMNISSVNIPSGQTPGFVGWNNSWNVQDVDYTLSYTTTGNTIIPGLDNNNDLPITGQSNLTAIIYDWSQADSLSSNDYKFMFYAPNSTSSRNFEDFVNESRRLDVDQLVNSENTVSTDSNDTLITKNLELQQSFGRLVFPKLDFRDWGPNYNDINNINYSTLSGTSLTFDVINDIDTLTTNSVTHTEYRWYVRRFETSGSTETMGNGTFEFDTNFIESDLNVTNDGDPGDGNLLLYMALTSGGEPDKWYDLSLPPNSGPRANATGGGSSNLDDNGEIAWNTGSVSGWVLYLLIGIKEGVPGNQKRIESIRITDNNWD